MLGHIDPVFCQHEWGTRFRALMERYQHIVRFGLQGHEHLEYYSIFNSMTNSNKPLMVHSVAGSLTPLVENGSNPTFMTLDLDAETMLPINKQTHYFDLEQANKDGEITWQSYDHRETYKMADMSPTSFMDLSNRIKTDKDLAAQWEWNELGRAFSPPATKDLKQIEDFCLTVSSESHEHGDCIASGGDKIGSFGSSLKLASMGGIIDRLIGSWIKRN